MTSISEGESIRQICRGNMITTIITLLIANEHKHAIDANTNFPLEYITQLIKYTKTETMCLTKCGFESFVDEMESYCLKF